MPNSTFGLGPIIALLTQGAGKHSSYVPASYVKWLEMAGARVVPVSYHATNEEVDNLFPQVNGALFPGGGSDTPGAARQFYKRAVASHAAGDPFPIWGTCDGFEWLMQIAAEDDGVLVGGFDSENLSLPLNLTTMGRSARLFADAPSVPVLGTSPRIDVLTALSTLPLTLNNHKQGVTPSGFAANVKLSASMSILATNVDRNGREFISVVEGRNGLPVFATQFHPEKNIFEQGEAAGGGPYEEIAHSRSAVAASQYMANFFVEQARASTHRFASDPWPHLIYSHTTTTDDAPEFIQIYSFPK
jgi:gamma-glutamyl hydrolase